jgi:hypothetical protein
MTTLPGQIGSTCDAQRGRVQLIDAVVRITELAGVGLLAAGGLVVLGHAVLIIADIVRTITVNPTPTTVLSLDVEMDGTWPWSRTDRRPTPTDSAPAAVSPHPSTPDPGAPSR